MTDWNALWRSQGHAFNQWPNEDLVRWASTLERGSRVLEVGCGNGANLRALQSFGLQAVGCDIAEEALLAAAGLSEALELKLTPACELSFPDESFDAVADVQCLQHLASAEEQFQAYREIHRVLKPGGRFFGVFLVAGQEHFPDLGFSEFYFPSMVQTFGFDAEFGSLRRNWHGQFYAYALVDAVKR